MSNRILWCDEIKIELYSVNASCHVWWKPGTANHSGHAIPTENDSGIMLGFFSVLGTEIIDKMEGKINAARCHVDILDQHLLPSALDPRLGQWTDTGQPVWSFPRGT